MCTSNMVEIACNVPYLDVALGQKPAELILILLKMWKIQYLSLFFFFFLMYRTNLNTMSHCRCGLD